MEIVTNITDLAERYDYYFNGSEYWLPPDYEKSQLCEYGKAKYFTIGRGKKEYHLITVQPMGFYYAFPMDEYGKLGWKRQVEIGTKITIHYDRMVTKK